MEPAEADAKTELTLEDLMQYMREQREYMEQRFHQQQAFNEHVQRSLEEINQRRSGRSSRANSEIIQVDQLSEIPVQQSLSVGVVDSNFSKLESVVSVQDVDIGDAIVVVEVDGETEVSSTDIASEDLELADDECYAVQKIVNDLVDSVVQYDVQSNKSLETFHSVVDFQVVIQDDVIDAENDVPIFFGKETTADDATDVFERMSVVPFSVSNAVLNSLMMLRHYSVSRKSIGDCLILLLKQYAACVVCQFLVKDKKLQLLMQKLVLIEEHGPGPPLDFL
mmetsp:Transcript_506/g.903  ORF Transcript_506/g.903 Transcript_506/m.903 type:complete len:280 (-) Transcript_506:600-1439(-)